MRWWWNEKSERNAETARGEWLRIEKVHQSLRDAGWVHWPDFPPPRDFFVDAQRIGLDGTVEWRQPIKASEFSPYMNCMNVWWRPVQVEMDHVPAKQVTSPPLTTD